MTTTTVPRNRSLVPVVAAVVTIALLLALSRAGSAPADNARKPWTQTRASQIVFFAVLEGLYRDGVSNDDVDRIIPPDEYGKPRFDAEHFVYACPLCHPAYEAFRLYRQRDRIYGFKADIDTFGPGLDAAIAARLRRTDANERRKAIEELISRWVSQRLDMMRLSTSERAAVTEEMARGRKQGMGGLKAKGESDSSSQSRTNCPICDGSFGACKLDGR